ncbi:CBO0543 family protein [Desulfolucanica intricata]|uniref:CBO0543 family protein n=1 Tax=Desulfolucanica intricata TaxID=1285191 RepID=UPI0008311FC4|nr:CBO0543 family protein [Desulfolucanica intricata]
MIFSIVLFAASWLCFFIFYKKEKFFLYAPTCYLAVILGLMTDVLTDHYPLWQYPASSEIQKFWRDILDDFGVYFVVTYLFLQALPQKTTLLAFFRYFFYWTLLAVSLEWIALKTGNMEYGLWWNIGYSYLADWLLFAFFYGHYRWQEKNRKVNSGFNRL